MTIPTEEVNALKITRDFLRSILHKNLTEIRKDAKMIRGEAYRCLRHFPWDMVIDDLWEGRIKDFEDSFSG